MESDIEDRIEALEINHDSLASRFDQESDAVRQRIAAAERSLQQLQLEQLQLRADMNKLLNNVESTLSHITVGALDAMPKWAFEESSRHEHELMQLREGRGAMVIAIFSLVCVVVTLAVIGFIHGDF